MVQKDGHRHFCPKPRCSPVIFGPARSTPMDSLHQRLDIVHLQVLQKPLKLSDVTRPPPDFFTVRFIMTDYLCISCEIGSHRGGLQQSLLPVRRHSRTSVPGFLFATTPYPFKTIRPAVQNMDGAPGILP